MLGINKITVSDDIDENGNIIYIAEVNYYIEAGKNRFGLPSLDLSRKTDLSSVFSSSGEIITFQDLTFPTFLETTLNPFIKSVDTGFRYPFTAKFNIGSSDSLNFTLRLQLFRKSTPKEQIDINLFSGGDLLIDEGVAIEDQRTSFYNNIFNIEIFTPGSSNNNSYLSQLYASYSKENSVRGMFIFDKQKFLMENSDFGYLLDNSRLPPSQRKEMLTRSSIVHMEITRRKLAAFRDFENKPYSSYKNQAPKTIAVGAIEEGVLSVSKGDMIQISDLDMSGMNYEDVVAFNDTDLLDLGTHQYTLNMRVQDGILGWMVATTDRLIKLQNNLNMPESLGPLVKIIFALNQNLNISREDLRLYLINMVKHEGSLNILKSHVTSLVNTLSNVIGNAGVISQVNTSYSKVYSANNTNRLFLTLEKRFDDTVNFDDAANLTYDYMGFPPNNSVGATTIGTQTMLARCDREYDKLLKRRPIDGYTNFSINMFSDVFGYSDATLSPLKLAYFNFEPNYFAFLSPVRVGEAKLSPSNTFNFDLMTDQHLKKSYDSQLTPQLSVSYYLQQNGLSLGTQFFREDPPLQDAQKGQTYMPANDIFADSDEIVVAPAGSNTTYTAGIDVKPETSASRLFASTFLRNKEGWDLSREDFNLTNKTNILSSLNIDLGIPSDKGESAELKIVRELPNHIRAIFASKSDKCVNQWMSMQGDYIYSPSTYYTIKQNYMNLLKIEYLSGFEKDANGLPDVKNPIFKKLANLNGSGKILCRASIYNDQRFKIGVAFDEISYADKYFILDLTEVTLSGIVGQEGL
jgi:hypothetical protein